MKNNSILILLISVLGFGILCAIVASIAFTYYNGGFDSIGTKSNETTFGDLTSGNSQSGLDIGSIMDSVSDAAGGMNMDTLYLAKLMQKFQTCQTNLAIFQASSVNLQADSSSMEDRVYLEEISGYLDDIKDNCGSLGENENVPEAYGKMNEELKKSDEYILEFVNNYQSYLTYKKDKYLDNGNEAYAKAFDHLQKAYTLMEDALAEQMP